MVAAEVAERMGFEPDDRAVLVSLVEHHLLLPGRGHTPRPHRPGHRRAGGRGGGRPAHPRPLGRHGRGRQPGHRPLGLGCVEGRARRRPRRADPHAPGRRAPSRRPGPASPTTCGVIMDDVRVPWRPGAGHRGTVGDRGGARPSRPPLRCHRRSRPPRPQRAMLPKSPGRTEWPSRSSRPSPSTGGGQRLPACRTT